MKRSWIIIMVLAIMLGLSLTANASSGTCGTGVNWSFSGRTLTISGSGAMNDYGSTMALPWKDYMANIVNIEIREGVTRIGDHAFHGCSSLKNVYMAKSVTSIGDYAFAWTTNLDAMGLGKGVTTLETYVFDESSIHHIEIPKSVTKIGKNCFTNVNSDINYGLENVYYEDSKLIWDKIDIASGNSALEASGLKMYTNQTIAIEMTLSSSSLSIPKGSSQVITASNWENVGLNSTVVKWTSSNTSVATVSNGRITGNAAGSATITASYHGYTRSCVVSVTEVYTEPEITLSYITSSGSSLKIGETGQFYAVSTTGSYIAGATWSSSNNAIATVSASGVVTGISEGTVTITASYNGKYVSTTVSVTYSVNFRSIECRSNEYNYSEYDIYYDQIYEDVTASVYILRYDLDYNYTGSYVYYVDLPAYSTQTCMTFPEYSSDGYLYFDITVHNDNGVVLGRLQVDDYQISKILKGVGGCSIHITSDTTADIYWGGYFDYDDRLGYLLCIPDYVKEDGEFYNITGLCDEAYSNYSYDTLIIPESVTKIGKYMGNSNLTDIYYMGSNSQWEAIEKKEMNMYLNNANIHYNYIGHNVAFSGFSVQPAHSDGVVGLALYVGKAYKDCTAVVEIRNHELDVLQKEYRFTIQADSQKEYPIFMALRPDDNYHSVFVSFEYAGQKCGNTIESDQFYAERPVFYENGFGYKNYEDEYAEIVEYIGTDSNVVVPQTLGGLPVENVLWIPSDHIETLHLPSTLKNINDYILMECINLKCIEVSEDNPYFCDIDGVLFTKDKKTMLCCPPGREGKLYAIPAGTETIGMGAIVGTKIEEVLIPDTVKCIMDTGLSKSGLKRVFIPATVEQIGDCAFGYCLNLEEIKVSEDNQYYCDIGGALHSKDGTILYQYPCAKKLHTYRIGDSVTKIVAGAFEMATAKTLYIPKTVTQIAMYALDGEFDCVIYEGTEEEFHHTFDENLGAQGAKWLYNIDCEDVIIGFVSSHYLDKKVTVKVEYDYLTKPGVCYVAIYDATNRIIAVDRAAVGLDEGITTIEFETEKDYTGYAVKVMYWDQDSTLTPVIGSVDGSVKESVLIHNKIETEHPCTGQSDSYQYDGECESMDITFSEETDAGDSGLIIIMTPNTMKYYYGKDLAGKTIHVKGNFVYMECYTGEEVYGYKVEKIVVNL